jgi:hypothetical protein
MLRSPIYGQSFNLVTIFLVKTWTLFHWTVYLEMFFLSYLHTACTLVLCLLQMCWYIMTWHLFFVAMRSNLTQVQRANREGLLIRVWLTTIIGLILSNFMFYFQHIFMLNPAVLLATQSTVLIPQIIHNFLRRSRKGP